MESDKPKRSKKKKVILFIILFLLIAALISGFFITSYEMNKNFTRGRYKDSDLTYLYYYDHYKDRYPRSEEITFMSGENTLKGRIYGEDNEKGLIVFAHGIGGGHQSYMSLIISMVDRGWKVFTYDATGSCESEGESTVGLSQSALDLNNALTFVEKDERLNKYKVNVLGHSWGGFAAAAVMNFDHDINACVSLSGYYQPEAELYETADNMFGKAGVLVHPFIWMYNKSKFGKYASLSAVDGINKTDTPVLIVHGTEDSTISFENASVISQKDRITNPNAEYYIFSDKYRNNHGTYFDTPESAEYKQKMNKIYEELYEKYNGNIPDEIQKDYYSGLDRDLLNETSDELADLIDNFFEKYN